MGIALIKTCDEMNFTLWKDGQPVGIIEVDGEVMDGRPTIRLTLIGEISLVTDQRTYVADGHDPVHLEVLT